MELSTSPIFQSAVYRAEAPPFLEETNRTCDPHIQKAKDNFDEVVRLVADQKQQNFRSVPQVVINGELIGGYEETEEWCKQKFEG